MRIRSLSIDTWIFLAGVLAGLCVPAGARADAPRQDADSLYDEAAAPSVLFDTNSTALRPEARVELARVAKLLRAHPELAIEVIGFADREGASVVYNQDLSERRARTAANYIAAHGVVITSIYAAGLGETRPAVGGGPLNRRVEIRLSGPRAVAATAEFFPPRSLR